MNLLKTFYYHACSFLPLQAIKQISPGTTFLPYHHIVSDEEVLHIKYLYSYKNVSQFKDDLDYLLKNFKPISVEDLTDSVNTKLMLPANSFLLTFDDGFREVYDIVAPILQTKGVPAIFFINPAFIDNKELFYRCKISLLIHELIRRKNDKNILDLFKTQLHFSTTSLKEIIEKLKAIRNEDTHVLDNIANELNFSFVDYLKKQQPFLTTEQTLSLHKQGFTIGAHSWNHPYYTSLNHEEQIEQTLSSCSYVKENFNPKPMAFSFPYSDVSLDQRLFDELMKSDINLLFGIQNQKDELRNKMLHRFNAERPEMPLNRQMKGMMLYMAMEKMLGKNKVNRN